MRIVRLEEICGIQIGRTPSRSVPEYWDGELPWVTISDLGNGRLVARTKERITRLGAEESRSKLVPAGTLLLSFKLSLGKRAFAGCDLYTNEAIAALEVRDPSTTDKGYLYWALGAVDYDRLVDRAAKGKTLNKAKLKVLQVPLPPLPEQKRIAAILDSADELRAKRRDSIDQLDTLLQSVFLDMFGDPVTNPKGWEVSQLSEAVQDGTIVTYGIVQAGKEFPGGTPYIRTGDLVDGEIRAEGLRHTDPEIAARFERSRVRTGEIVMSIRATVGTTARVPPELDGANLTQGTARISPGARTDPWFLLHFLRARGSQTWLRRQVKGATFREITLGRLRQMPVHLPPLDLQSRFASIVESVERQRDRLRAHLDELDTLFASLQTRAFRGDL